MSGRSEKFLAGNLAFLIFFVLLFNHESSIESLFKDSSPLYLPL